MDALVNLLSMDALVNFLRSAALNTAGSVAVMALIAVGIQAIEDVLSGNPKQFPRFPALRTACVRRPNPLTCNIHVAVLFGLAMALLRITVDNPFPNSFGEFIVRFVVSLVVYDFGLFVTHGIQHILPIAIKYHRVHHQVPLYAWDVINADLVDFIEDFVPILIVPTLFQYNIAEVWILTVVLQFHGAVVHSGCSVPVVDCMDAVVVGPRFHALHHVLHKRNYGAFFSVWDWLFGTAVSIKETEARLWRPRKTNEKFVM